MRHYKHVKREFIHMPKWIIIVKVAVFIGIIVAYFLIWGKELDYAMYIPFDVLLEFTMFVYRKGEEKLNKMKLAQKNAAKMSNNNMLGLSDAQLDTIDDIEEKIELEVAMKFFRRTDVFKPGNDTYSMAFKAFHKPSCDAIDLSPREVFESTQALFAVSGIQLALIYVIFMTITDGEEFKIVMPDSMSVLAVRFTCSILMHL